MKIFFAAVAVWTLVASEPVSAQGLPSRPITMIVPFEPGGAIDVIARVIAAGMEGSLDQRIVFENVVGAAGRTGLSRLVAAPPDGYTFSIGGWGPHVAHGALYQLKYDLEIDFEPVALVASQSLLIAAKTSIPAEDLNGLIAWLKANPEKSSMGTGGIGTPGHVSAVLFGNATGTRFQIAPYQNAGRAMQDMVAGKLDMQIATPITALPAINAGNVKVFAVTSSRRLEIAPNIPTVDEAGLPGFYASNWQAFWAPKGTPKAALDKINAVATVALNDATVRKRLAELGQELYPRDQQSAEALQVFHKAEIAKWWPIIKGANIKVE